MQVRLAHFSDSHIGYEAYRALSVGGENQRAVDVAKAFVATVDDIIADDPPLVVHSGDLAERTVIPIRLMLLIRKQLVKLASIRPDGTRRQVVLIAGNHELPRNRKEACFLHLFDGLPGVHVVTRDYTQITFPGTGTSLLADPILADVVVHALPHDALKTVDFDLVQPIPGKINILTAHGVAGGSELYLRSLGREFTIPTEVLARDWNYGALGHWHKQGPVPLGATGGSRKEPLTKGRVWYAGSTENMGFGDLRENGIRRGWLRVTVETGEEPVVERRNIPIRLMVRLALLDGQDHSPEVLTDMLITRIRNQSVSGAVVGQIVENVPRDVWSLVDMVRVRAAAGDALHYEVNLRSKAAKTDTINPTKENRGFGDIEAVLVDRAAAILSDEDRPGGLAMARELLVVEMERSARSGSTDVDDPSKDAPSNDNSISEVVSVTADIEKTETSETVSKQVAS